MAACPASLACRASAACLAISPASTCKFPGLVSKFLCLFQKQIGCFTHFASPLICRLFSRQAFLARQVFCSCLLRSRFFGRLILPRKQRMNDLAAMGKQRCLDQFIIKVERQLCHFPCQPSFRGKVTRFLANSCDAVAAIRPAMFS